MQCPNCGFVSAPGSMFCGNCGTRLSAPAAPAAPAQRPATSYPNAAPTYQAPPAYNPPAYTPPAYNQQPAYKAPYQPPAGREASYQYQNAVDSVSLRSTAPAKPYKERKDGWLVNLLAVCIIAMSALFLYSSGVFSSIGTSRAPIDTPADSPSQNIVIADPNQSDSDTSTTPSVPVTSATDAPESDNPNTNTPAGIIPDSMPDGFTTTDRLVLNSFLSAFTEVQFPSFVGVPSNDELASFAIESIVLNSNIYKTDSFVYGDKTYTYNVAADKINERIERYFGYDFSQILSFGHETEDWLFYNGLYYFSRLPSAKGFAVATSLERSDNGNYAVEFRIYASTDDDSQFYGITAQQVNAMAQTLIGTGTAVIRPSQYNGRDSYILLSYNTEYLN